MWGRLAFVCVVLASGCWSDDDLIDGAFTPDQWARLQDEFRPPAMDPCAIAGFAPAQHEQCSAAMELGGLVFTDTNLSSTKTVSCQSCHDPRHGWIDSRMPNDVSQGANGATTRNSMTIWNVGYKVVLAQQTGKDPRVFTWGGGNPKAPSRTGTGYERPGDILELAEHGRPLDMPHHADVVAVVASNAVETNAYERAFGPLVLADPDAVFANLERALDAYLSTVVTVQTPFDLWLAGQDSPMTDSARRGFAVFVGRGTCISCHRGYLFSDLEFHDTGVPQTTSDPGDAGRAAVTKDSADTGKFITPTLREIASTGPYFHNGSTQSLAEVIDFYRRGGTPDGDGGQKDARIQPLDLSDQDVQDLEAFLESLTQCDGTTCPASRVKPDCSQGACR